MGQPQESCLLRSEREGEYLLFQVNGNNKRKSYLFFVPSTSVPPPLKGFKRSEGASVSTKSVKGQHNNHHHLHYCKTQYGGDRGHTHKLPDHELMRPPPVDHTLHHERVY